MDELLSTSAVWRTLGLRRGLGRSRVIRALHRNGDWSPEEAAGELHRRRAELIGQLRRRSEGRGVPLVAQEEIVDDAITAVVMSPRGIANEHHLLGAFWLAVDHRCRRYREGRHFARLGSRLRVEFEVAAQRVSGSANPFDSLELRDRFARAADLMADLDVQERQVVSVMACNGVGPVSAARMLGRPLGEVRSAVRSANAKLDRVAAISAAGRMCQFRAGAIAADAAGEANDRQTRLARAHVSACVPCGRVYRQLRREMRGREFQRAAAAAFLPVPAVSLGHVGGVGKIAVWIEQRINCLPRGSGTRAAEVLGGAGIAKAAVAGTALVAATASIATHTLRGKTPAYHRYHRAVAATMTPPAATTTPAAMQGASVSRGVVSPAQSTAALSPHQSDSIKRLPRDLRYLAVGGGSPPPRLHPATAVAASASASKQAPSASTTAPGVPTGRTASVHSSTGGRFKYLGR
jgi:DNA-directed RNA polymerase specialized sigma24 family protein